MQVIHFADFTLDCRTRQLCRGTEVVAIGARAYDLLEVLIARRDRVVGRDEIMEAVWPGTVVGENNLNVQVASLRRLLRAEAIVTVPRRGLRFALDVATASSLPDRPSVAVLPFSTFGGDPGLDWLADGFVEDITTELSRFRDLFVVARNSAFVYRGMPRDLRVVARELGVGYVVEGSVRATSAHVRVTAQLIDATTGGHVWAETFDRKTDAHFDMQAIVARAVVSCLTPQIDRAEADRIRVQAPDDLTAYGLARQGWTVISSAEMSYDSGPRDRAAALARTALEDDPRSGLALRILAWVAWWNLYHGTTASAAQTSAEGIEAATRAVAVDPADHHARRLRAKLHLMGSNVAAGLPELRRAHELNPNCALTLCWLGFYEAINGDPARGVGMARAGLRRSPCDPARGSMLCALGFALFAARDYAGTAEAARAARAEAAGGATPLVLGAIGEVGLGRIDAARRAVPTSRADRAPAGRRAPCRALAQRGCGLPRAGAHLLPGRGRARARASRRGTAGGAAL